jgi:hypothetical protein
VLLVQISDSIFKLACFLALWQTRDDHVDPGWDVQAAFDWPISHHLADAKFVGGHPLAFPIPGIRQCEDAIRDGTLSYGFRYPLAK